MIRDFRASDGTAMAQLLMTQFPEEEALLGTHPEAFFQIIKRVSRIDARIIFAFLRLFGRPVFEMLVNEEEGKLVGTTLLTFPARSVYLSMVVVDPAARRKGYAKALLARANEVARRMKRRYLVLDVLTHNAPARALYEQKLGYRPLRESAFMSRERPADLGPERASLPSGIRPHRPTDDAALAAIGRRQVPKEVQEVLPVSDHPLAGTRQSDRIFESQSAAWVLDRGSGAEGMVYATAAPLRDAAHLSDPILSADTDPALARELIRVALAWCGARGGARVVTSVPRYNTTARAVLEAEGFHDALSTWTLYLPVA